MKNTIIYDFDGTLTPLPIPKFDILEKCGLQNGALNPEFLEIVKKKAVEENIELYDAVYRAFFQIIRKSNLPLTDDNFCIGAESIAYNEGVEDFLSYLKNNGVNNYLLSSGLKVFLERTSIAHSFKQIYATTFIYDDNNEATEVDYLMSDKNKVSVIKEIIKSIGKKEDDCKNVIYIGDGLTDYYAMEYVKNHGGTSIFVYKNQDRQDLSQLEENGVISYSAFADFRENSDLCNYIECLCFSKQK